MRAAAFRKYITGANQGYRTKPGNTDAVSPAGKLFNSFTGIADVPPAMSAKREKLCLKQITRPRRGAKRNARYPSMKSQLKSKLHYYQPSFPRGRAYQLGVVLRYTTPPVQTSMAKRGKVQTWLEYAVARAIFGGLSAMPASWALTTGQGLGRVAYVAAGDLKRTGHRNLKLAFPEKTEQERQQLLRECFAGLGRQLGLFSKFATSNRESLLDLTRWEGLEQLEAAKAKNKPVILFTGHVGAWELSSFGLSLREQPLSFLVRRIDNPKVEELVDRIRMRFGNQSVDKRGAARPMLNILRTGGTLGLLVDLNTLDEEAIFVDFFGVPASTTFMLAKLALRTDATVLPIFVPWDKDRAKFLVQILPEVSVARTGDEEADVRELTANLTKVLEDYIRRYPDQWLWIHRRWKTRPKGEPDLYQ